MTQKEWLAKCRALVKHCYPGSENVLARVEIAEHIRKRIRVTKLSGFFIDREWDWQRLYQIEHWLQNHPWPPADTDNPVESDKSH